MSPNAVTSEVVRADKYPGLYVKSIFKDNPCSTYLVTTSYRVLISLEGARTYTEYFLAL